MRGLLQHDLLVGDDIDVLGEAPTADACHGHRGATDHEHRSGDAAAPQAPVELGKELRNLARIELVALGAGAHAVTRSRSGM